MMVGFFSFDSVSFFRFAFCLVLQNRKRLTIYNGPDFDSSGSDHNHLHSLSLEPSISCFSVPTFLEKKKKTQNFKNSKTRVPFIARESIVPRVEKFIQDSQAPPQTN